MADIDSAAEVIFEKLLTPKEAAVLADVSRVTIYRWIRADLLPHVTLPSGRYRISITDLHQAVNAPVDAKTVEEA